MNASEKNTEKAKLLENNQNKESNGISYEWKWMKYEKITIILMVVAYWTYFFVDFAFFNLEIKSKISGMKSGYFGYQRDEYDSQWAKFRSNLWLIIIIGMTHLIGSTIVKKYFPPQSTGNKVILIYNSIFGLLYLTYIFGAGIIFWLLFSFFNYFIALCFRQKSYYEIILWGCTILILYCNETYQGYRFHWISERLQILDDLVESAPLNWHVIYNMTILRVMSFCLDWSWSTKNRINTPKEKHIEKCTTCNKTTICLKIRQESHQDFSEYNPLSFISYLSYPPLFLSGPVVTYNAFISQINFPQNTYSKKSVIYYLLRVVFNYVCFEIFLHFYFVSALSNNPKNIHIWQTFSLKNLGLMSFCELVFLWFKFLIIWRIPRAWALFDGIETPENMNRCICNNYTFEGFWRSWHRGFNQWLIRYLFIPLGGSKYKLYNIWVVFTFVAIWHDMNINLIVWAWGICISLMPEMLIRWYFAQKKFSFLWNKVWWKYICAFAGGIDVLLMVTANLIGFGIGWNGLLKSLIVLGLITITIGIFGFSIATLTMFMIRERESDSEKKGF